MEKYLSTMEMAGYCAADSVSGVSTGEVLMPIVGTLRVDGQRQLSRLVGGSIESIAMGTRKLMELDAGVVGASFIKDAVVTFETGKTDCLMVDIRFAADPGRELSLLMPYRNAAHGEGFAVHRPHLTGGTEGLDEDTVQALVNAFFVGIRSHEAGFAVWEAHYIAEPGDSSPCHGEESTDFSIDELFTLMRAPFLVFFIVAAADGKVDQKELAGLAKLLAEAGRYGNPLLTRIVTNVIDKLAAMASSLGEQELHFGIELMKIASIVDERMPAAEAQAFKRALLCVAEDIAKASGGLFGFGSRISKAERTALTQIALCLGIDAPH